ncbi:hypothetical protein [Kiloniella antarctica]|uniref:Surface antigen domain-containing protein n=1 Tax=Kiloniella antarctica TaxID=1550907 RepID=A0ABW5BT54_9PROT
MKLNRQILPAAAIILSTVLGSEAMARSLKGSSVHNSNPSAHYTHVRPIAEATHAHRIKQKSSVYIGHRPMKITQKHFHRLTTRQRKRYESAFLSAATISNGRFIYWKEGDASGSISFARDISLQSNCRSYIQTVTINRDLEKVKGVACLQKDNRWNIIY